MKADPPSTCSQVVLDGKSRHVIILYEETSTNEDACKRIVLLAYAAQLQSCIYCPHSRFHLNNSEYEAAVMFLKNIKADSNKRSFHFTKAWKIVFVCLLVYLLFEKSLS
jgi:hypothetical protein